ncbi:helix-turn-helix domain-containing protein [Streptacidiphilus fuscans]|uniref:Helix-turn-helix domain-containing protein n=1 Tax=Streptacidiphilus fuscans TaxID=2789292 RepID=A0A931B451_9ACTN|nr:helix-turn-helix transcriptional regulator [Streptacidiphilus fuscans]MBF9068992.1 helix-turn-helix domain-containing protein [Streptacidiphilus fuscans]
MAFESSGADPNAEPIRFGQRMQLLRTRRGMTREVLAGLLGKSPSWVKQIENGRLQMPRLDTVLAIAEALRVRDLSDLTGGRKLDAGMFIGPGHPRLPAVAEAVNALPGPARDRQAASVAHLRARLASAWAARHSAPNHRDVVGALLPDLIRDAQLAVRQADSAADRRAAQAALAEVYCLSQFFVAYQPDSSLLWRVAERGMVAAQESEDPRAVGVSAWLAAQAHRDSGPGHFDAADSVTTNALAYLEPLLADATDDVLSIAGALTFEAGYTAARRGDTGVAWAHWDRAHEMAQRLPSSFYDPITSFSRAIMGAHAVTVAVELHAGGESVRQAARAEASVIPSRPRRARHRIEQARAYQLDGRAEAALATLEQAWEAAPETIKYNGYAKRIILEEAEAAAPARRQRAADLAAKVGLLAA